MQRGAPLKDVPQNKHLLEFPLNLAPANFISPRSQLVYEKRQRTAIHFLPAVQRSLLPGTTSSTTGKDGPNDRERNEFTPLVMDGFGRCFLFHS